MCPVLHALSQILVANLNNCIMAHLIIFLYFYRNFLTVKWICTVCTLCSLISTKIFNIAWQHGVIKDTSSHYCQVVDPRRYKLSLRIYIGGQVWWASSRGNSSSSKEYICIKVGVVKKLVVGSRRTVAEKL